MQPACAFIYASAIDVFTKKGDDLRKGCLLWGLVFIVLGISNLISYYLQNSGFGIAGEHLTFTLRKEMYSSIIKQEVGFFDTNNVGAIDDKSNTKEFVSKTNSGNTGNLTAKLSTEATLVQSLNMKLGLIVEIISSIIVCFTVAFICGWKLTLILSITAPFLFLGTYIHTNDNS